MNLNQVFADRDSYLSWLIRRKARQLVRRSEFNDSERSDIEQELAVAVIQKHKRYDPARAKEETFLARIVDSKAISLIRARSARKRICRRTRSLNESVKDADGRSVEFAQTLDTVISRRHRRNSSRSEKDQTQLRLDVMEVLRSMPDDLRQLADLLQIVTESAASSQLSRSRRDVANDVARLRELLAKTDLPKYL